MGLVAQEDNRLQHLGETLKETIHGTFPNWLKRNNSISQYLAMILPKLEEWAVVLTARKGEILEYLQHGLL
jgi:hypothetical protein